MHKIKPDNIKYGWGWSHEVLPSRRLSEEKKPKCRTSKCIVCDIGCDGDLIALL